MSIATLKRKSNNIHGSFHSSKNGGFSLNGTYRNQYHTGSNLGIHYPRTIMKGDIAKGYGGCCGNYNRVPIVKSDGFSTEDNSVVKSSVVGTTGMIKMKYRWINRPYPYSTLKPKDVIQCCSAECNFIM